jgi:eukaryotic-like serine/threonine-protein kinase
MLTIKLQTGVFEYDPAKPLGKCGGFGQVFAGKTASGQDVAIKKLHVSAADAAHRELRIADELKGNSYDHVIPFIDAGEDADTGNYFVVMSKAEGSLQGSLDKGGPLNAAEAASVLLQIVKGLLEVGELVHRDLKPDNVLFHQGKWKVADFGIARFVEEATASNTVKDCLSPYYAAPEQWRFERATHATDIYALGCIGFFLLTGKPPFISNPAEEHQKAAVPSFLCTDSRLAALTNMMLRKLPETRPVLSRIRDLLNEIVSKPQHVSNSDPLAVLAQSAAKIAISEQRLQAQRQGEMAARNARSRLAVSAFEILKDSLERLWGKIHSQAPNATRGSSMNAFQCNLGDGSLYVDLSRRDHFDAGLFRQSRWDVVCLSQVKVSQEQPEYIWSASLWYMKLPEAGEYRWYEVAYWSWQGNNYQPFSTSDFRAADIAASKVMGLVNIAFGPDPIDDEKEDDFHSRWVWLLAKAAASELRRPRSMPIERWPPQFA